MAITTRSRMLGLLLALSAVTALPPEAPAAPADSPADEAVTVDARLSRIAAALRTRDEDPAAAATNGVDALLALGWADGRGNRGWVNTRYGGAARGRRGGWGNVHPYYGPRRSFFNGGGGFYNGSYRPRGTFVNW